MKVSFEIRSHHVGMLAICFVAAVTCFFVRSLETSTEPLYEGQMGCVPLEGACLSPEELADIVRREEVGLGPPDKLTKAVHDVVLRRRK